MKEVYYWSPCLTKVGPYRSTFNSAISLANYSNKQYSVKIINSCGEWSSENELLKKNNIELINFGFNYFSFFSNYSYTNVFVSKFHYQVNNYKVF